MIAWGDPPQGWAGGSTRRWRKIRAAVLARDGYVCQLRIVCAGAYATHADHKIPKRFWPRDRPGCDDPENLQAACRDCNLAKGTGAGVLRQWSW